MNQAVIEGIRALRNHNDRMQVESLFSSERSYWLTTSLAIDFALAELKKTSEQENINDDDDNNEMLVLFREALRKGEISDETFAASRIQALKNLDAIKGLLRETCVFNPERALPLCESFVSYWLFTTLIEVEWQGILEKEEQKDSYMFLDGVISDQEELATIRNKMVSKKTLFDDEIIYLRTHWQIACDFFNRLQNTLMLLDRGLVDFVTLRPQHK